MRTRFGRGRRTRGPAERKAEPIDAGRSFQQLIEAGTLSVESVEAVEVPGIAANFAVLGSAQTKAGERVLVSYSPTHGGDAVLAGLAYAKQLAEAESFAGEVIAIAPTWSIAARSRLALLGEVPFRFRAVAVSGLDSGGGTIDPERGEPRLPVPAARLAEICGGPDGPEIFLRALSALEGLAAKHGGAVRGTSDGAELVLMARRCAVLRPGDGGVVLEATEPEKSTATLTSDSLAASLDRLEGSLRKRLNDRKVKGGEEGMRALAVSGLVQAAGLHSVNVWPLAGSDPEVLDVVGLEASGRPVIGIVREELDLPGIAAALDSFVRLRPALAALFASSAGPLRLAEPRLALAAERIDPAVLQALGTLAVKHDVYELRPQRGDAPQVVHLDSAAGAPAIPATTPRGRGRGPGRAEPRSAEREREPDASEGREEERDAEASSERPRRRRRGGRRGGRSSANGEAREAEAGSEENAEATEVESGAETGTETGVEGEGREERAAAPRAKRRGAVEKGGIEEMSLFDLDDDAREGDDDGPRRRRRRGRRRGGRNGQNASAEERPESEDAGADADPGDDDIVDDDPEALLAPLDDDLLDAPPVVPDYDDDDGEEEEPGDKWMAEREVRRLARAKQGAPAREPVADDAPKVLARRRSAIVAHADPDSVMAAILLARDIRMLEGFWVYPQEDLMTFFRGVATDLRPETPIYVVGFPAKPARDTIQAASLYSDRLVWFDHHDWPPEDLESLRQTLGAECVEIEPASGSSIPGVLARRQRRSRFSDKLVELATGRFTQHDFERWGRVWAERIRNIAKSPGDQRHAIDPLLNGRPSDLAKDASRSPVPDTPPEVAYVSERDFRVVHFGGIELVVVPVPPEYDPYLLGRLARERFGAQISLCHREGEDLVLLGGEEQRGRNGLDLGAMVSHLDSKHAWITGLRDDDHVARMRIRDLETRPERLDELVAEVAMGRSILEG